MRSMRALLPALAVVALVAAGCGDDDTTSSGTTTSDDTTTTAEATTTTAPQGLEQPAVWPAADVVFDTPDAAAEDFVTQVLGVPPALGEFMQGDSRSGEIELRSPGEGGGTAVPRGIILMRQLGPDDGWFVIGVANDNASITTPESLATVAAGPLLVEGVARGFEANVNVRAFVAGDASTDLDQQITMGGSMETPEPISVTLDLSGASSGDVVVILVRGGTGLETDPGEVGAIAVVIA
jgi:hypothetical protein